MEPADVTAEVCLDTCDPARLAAFWGGLVGYRVDGDPGARWVHLVPPHPGLPILNLQRVPEPKAGKNRLHLDLYVADPVPWVARAEDLGAEAVHVHDEPDDWFVVLHDPEGNEFCICREACPADGT